MNSQKSVLVVSHVIHRSDPPHALLEGPYSSVIKALSTRNSDVSICLVPLNSFNNPVEYGAAQKKQNLQIPSFFGYISLLKYILDMIVIAALGLLFLFKHKKDRLIITIDPLCCISLVLLKILFRFKLAYYSVDYNSSRFKNPFLSFLYQKCDEYSCKFADQVWVVCESLKMQKKELYNVESIYIPNSTVFDSAIYEKNKHHKKGNKLAWTGSLLTDRQFDILFRVLKEIQQRRSEFQIVLAPTGKHEKFEKYAQDYKLKQVTVLRLRSRSEWQEHAARYDVGIAIYDETFESTRYIEPLKIWDFMMCGMPFIISSEPSISKAVRESGVAYFLRPTNQLPTDGSLERFLDHKNIEKLQSICIKLAKEYDIGKQIKKALFLL